MLKKILILSLLFFTACKPADKSDAAPEASPGEKIFQKSNQAAGAALSILGVWELPTVTEPGANITIRIQIEKDKTTSVGKCEFTKDGKVIDTLYALASSPSSYTDTTFTTEKDASVTSTNADRKCQIEIQAGTHKYTLNAESKTLCMGEDANCTAAAKRVAD